MISLVALPGGGKSTAGRLLARRLGYSFVDADVQVERQLGCSIRQYFELAGEAAFRDVEQACVEDLTRLGGPVVLATGGGVVLRPENRQALRSRSTVVYLRSTPEDLHKRLRHDTRRPLLQVNDPHAKLRELFNVRDPLYRETAHFVVDTGRPTLAALVNMVVMQLELAGVITAPLLAGSPVRTPSEVTVPENMSTTDVVAPLNRPDPD